tara:strand:- start:7 stop:540 length:534 start_codon:yes stop_codon:yes gene_type:complete
MAKKPSMKSNFSTEEEEKLDKAIAERSRKYQADRNEAGVNKGYASSGLPVVVRTNGKIDSSATGELSAKNFIDATKEKYKLPDSARARAKKNYNVPAQITEEDRQKGRDEITRTKREMTSDSDVPASDKEGLTNMIESEEGFRRGGSVRKYAEGGLVRGSVRGGGVALRGLGKGKVC